MFPRIFLRLARLLFVLGLASMVVSTASAASPKVKVDVRAVRFNLVAPAGASARWFEADIEVDARVTGGRTGFVDRVQVSLDLGTRVLGGAYRFYRSEMEAVALENGVAHFRFYLPAEVVKRDGLGGEPEFWAVQIIADGEPQPASALTVSASLRGGTRRRDFEAKIAAEAPTNDGVLQPQHLTPFATQYPLATPSPVRRPR